MAKKLLILALTTTLSLLIIVLCGCAPIGYVRSDVVSHTNPISKQLFIINQFPEENVVNDKTKHYFSYKQELYYVESSGEGNEYWSSCNDYLVFKNDDLIGSFVVVSLANSETRTCRTIFSQGDFLYYQYELCRKAFAFNHHMTKYYSKYVYYSFDLRTGKNKEVGFDTFESILKDVKIRAT